MQLNTAFSTIKKSLVGFLHRFHVMVFVIVVLNGMIVVVLLLNGIIAQSSDSGDYTPTTESASFDQSTIDRIKQLRTGDQTGSDLDLSNGRVNPFVE